MFSTRRREVENKVVVVGPGYTFDITKEAAEAGVSYGVLTLYELNGYYYVKEPYGYYDALELPRDPRK